LEHTKNEAIAKLSRLGIDSQDLIDSVRNVNNPPVSVIPSSAGVTATSPEHRTSRQSHDNFFSGMDSVLQSENLPAHVREESGSKNFVERFREENQNYKDYLNYCELAQTLSSFRNFEGALLSYTTAETKLEASIAELRDYANKTTNAAATSSTPDKWDKDIKRLLDGLDGELKILRFDKISVAPEVNSNREVNESRLGSDSPRSASTENTSEPPDEEPHGPGGGGGK